MTFLMLNFKMG